MITVSIIFLLRSEMVSCPLRSWWEICFQNHFPPSEELIICQSELNRSPFPSLSAAAGELDFVSSHTHRALFHPACVSRGGTFWAAGWTEWLRRPPFYLLLQKLASAGSVRESGDVWTQSVVVPAKVNKHACYGKSCALLGNKSEIY